MVRHHLNFFCNLECKKFIDKTVKKVSLETGEYITDQEGILCQIQDFYAKLFKSRNKEIPDIKLTEILKDQHVIKLTKLEASLLEGPLTISEFNFALRKMTNNKAPGVDGIPCKFLKVFWFNLKYLILKALNYSYYNGNLSITLRQAVITCIPKGDKNREFLNNWRPISLLSILYKLMASAIAERLKTVLDKLISDSQTGFIKGRYIGDSTRLIYDIMNFTEIRNKNELLMLIHFEKAFDSISGKFMYNTLNF